jgi:hypothetical protein
VHPDLRLANGVQGAALAANWKKKKRKEKQRNVQVKQVQRPRTRAPDPPGWPALKSRIHQLWTSADFADDPRVDGKSRCQKLIYLLLFLLTTHGDQHDSIGTLDYFLLLLRPGHIVWWECTYGFSPHPLTSDEWSIYLILWKKYSNKRRSTSQHHQLDTKSILWQLTSIFPDKGPSGSLWRKELENV